MKTSILFLLIIANVTFSQDFNNSIKGRIIDAKTKEPMVGVQVYISETTWGTTTNLDGTYKIKSIPPGKHELIVSMIGFKVKTQFITVRENNHTKIDFRLEEVDYELETVEVIAERPSEWFDQIEIFKKYFIGNSRFTKNCKIENEEVVSFKVGANGELFGYTSYPIKIINEDLGYKVSVVLMSFVWDSNQGRVRYSVKPRFIEMEAKDELEKELWIKNRNYAYNGSINHFMRELKNDSFKDANYKIYISNKIVKNPIFLSLRAKEIRESKELLKKGMVSQEHLLDYENYMVVVYNRGGHFENEVSWLKLNMGGVTLDQFGYPEEFMPFQSVGRWARLGLANWLPKYYDVTY